MNVTLVGRPHDLNTDLARAVLGRLPGLVLTVGMPAVKTNLETQLPIVVVHGQEFAGLVKIEQFVSDEVRRVDELRIEKEQRIEKERRERTEALKLSRH